MLLKRKIRTRIRLINSDGIWFVKLNSVSTKYTHKCSLCKLSGSSTKLYCSKMKSPLSAYDDLELYCTFKVGRHYIPYKYIKNLKNVIQEEINT